ncbi:DNA-3-methyladenine glycosylase [Pontibacter pudoricolor]|uniref:DNA-3-methyladenine glycosylase n=1 Tax=Pontibacter pudoricolor TaxID=2694930 RepID=UPI001EE4E1AE|nr:DNA-3-methyladenine glycosylase [Pontibacter pudoricolor]
MRTITHSSLNINHYKVKLTKDFYTRPNVVQIAQELLGKYLYTSVDGMLTGGMIVETEAYSGENDRACHAHLNRRTARTEIMYHEGGVAYVYLVYGIYNLFNIITNIEGKADAVLIRAVEPEIGVEEMLLRRNIPAIKPNLTAGPGVMSIALGINRKHYGESLTGNTIWVEDKGKTIPEESIMTVPRVGIDYAGDDALLPWRFYIKDSKWVSRK